MIHVDASIAQRAEFADTQPDLRALAAATRRARAVRDVKTSAKPFLLGAALGLGAGFALAALTLKKPPHPLALFPEPRPVVFKKLLRAALIATGRALVRRALSRAAARANGAPA